MPTNVALLIANANKIYCKNWVVEKNLHFDLFVATQSLKSSSIISVALN